MKIRFLGTRGGVAVPSVETIELGGNTTSAVIQLDNGSSLIIDAGTGIIEYAAKCLDLNRDREFHILMTHFHWDHILGFPFFFPIHSPTVKINIYSTVEAEDLKGRFSALFDGTYSPLRDIKNTKAALIFQKIPPQGMMISGAMVRAHKVDHTDPCDAYRIEADSKVLSFVTDHETRANEKNSQLIKFISDSHLLIHDAEYTAKQYETHKGWGHSSIENAIKNATLARAKRVLLTHHDPNNSDDFLRLYLHRLFKTDDTYQSRGMSIGFAEESVEYEF